MTSDAREALARAMAESEGWRWDDDRQMLDEAAAGWQKSNRERETWRRRAATALSYTPSPQSHVRGSDNG